MIPLTRTYWLLLFAVSLAFVASAEDLTCPAVNAPADRNFRGQTIVKGNFAYRDLANADFSHATLVAPYFAFANLTNANFEGAVFLGENGNPTAVGDFSFANLQKTCFIRTRFDSLTYFTSASLTCANFSETDLTNHNAVFGGTPLDFDRARTDCRPAFRFAKMDCEFLSEWRYLDLTGADIAACSSSFSGHDFSGAKLDNVNFAGADLSGANFIRASLNGANLTSALLIGANLSYATLLGAQLNRANLTNASLYYAFLSNDSSAGISNAASLKQSHLKNVNLSYARLNGVDFTYANFYSNDPVGTGVCKTAPSLSQCGRSGSSYEGFACNCASAHGAGMTKTQLKGAYLYGVDFTEAQMQGTDFQEAVLTGANLSGATIRSDSGGIATTFYRAFLQGTNLVGASFNDPTTFSSAFVDFRPDGNNISIFLDGANHNEFVCKDCTPATGSNVCVFVNYPNPTRFPDTSTTFACPEPGVYGNCGPQDSNGSNSKWKSNITDLAMPPTGVPPAWYESDSTYIKAPLNPHSICKGEAPVIFW